MTAESPPPSQPLSSRFRRRSRFKKLFSGPRLTVFLFLFIVFTIWTYAMGDAGLDDGPKHNGRVLRSTLGTITGPFTGAIARDFQGCCTEIALRASAVCAPVLALGVLSQLLWTSETRPARITKLILWSTAWFLWFMGGIFSLLHGIS